VVGRGQGALARRAVPGLRPENVIEEAVGRNTAASVALAAHLLTSRHGDAVMVVLPADHMVGKARRWLRTIRRAAAAAAQTGSLLAIGVPVGRPEPGFGYLKPGRSVFAPGIHHVSAFVEKPPARRAARMVRSGRWLWNSGMFVWRAGAILDELARLRPDIAGPIASWAGRLRRFPRRVPARLLGRLPAESIDRAVLERTADLLVARGDFSWSDLGSWTDVIEALGKRRQANRALGPMLSVDSSGCLGASDAGPIAFVGVRDLIAVRSGDAVLVCDRHRAQQVRELTDREKTGGGRWP